MAASTYLAQVQQLYIAYFGRPADPIGLQYWATQIDAANGSIAAVQAGFSASAESTALFGNKSSIDKVTAIYLNAFGRAPEPAGLSYWVAQLDSGKVTQAQASWTIQQSAGAGDAAAVQNKLTAAQAFTAQIDTTAEIQGYQGNAAADSGRAFLATVNQNNATATAAVTNAATALATAINAQANAGSNTVVLTTNIDNLTGTSGNDVFVGVASAGATNTVGVADQINGGAGNDTLKVFIDAAQAVGSVALPQLTSVENVYYKGGTMGAVSVATIAGVTGLELDTQAVVASAVITTTAAQSVTVDNYAGAVGTNTLTLAAATKLQVNAVTATIDVAATAATALTINATGAASTLGLTNTGAALTSLVITGDKGITITEGLTALTTVNASANTGGVTFNDTATNNLTFTGGTGNDKVSFAAGTLTNTDVLDGGAGIDTLVINDTALTTANYAGINAVKNFEILALGTTGGTLDVSQVTGFTQFAVARGNLSESFTNGLSTSKFSIDNFAGNSGTVSIANKVGETSTSVTIDNSSTGVQTLAGLTLTGVTNVALASTGTSANVITAFNNADNSSIVVTGAAGLSLTVTAGTVGSKVDGTAATGVLKLTGNTQAFAAGSSLGDTLIGGSAADVLKASVNGGTLTGNGGNDTFDVSAAKGGVATTVGLVTVTDFTKGDILKVTGSTFVAAKVDLTSATSVSAALDALSAGTTAGVKWGVYAGNTYVVDDNTAGTTTLTAADTAVKLNGVLDLSTSTFAANALTFA